MSRFTRRFAALTATLLGLGLLIFTLAGAASAWSGSEDGTPTCQPGNAGDWVANFTVHNDPDASFGAATISGTGTALDGQMVAAGGGTRSVAINEPHATGSVTVAGILTWSGGQTAPFTHTETIPPACVVTTPTPTKSHTHSPPPTHSHSKTPPASTTAPVTSTSPVAVASSPPPLATTGTDSTLLITMAAALIAGGVALFTVGRRRHGH